MADGSRRRRVPDLGFRVFGRGLHPDWFAVKAFRRVARDGWEADVRVVDGGHAVHFRADRWRITEALVGPETPLPEPGLLFHAGLKAERSAALRPTAGIEYQTSFDVERCDPEVFAHLTAEATLDAGSDALFHAFAPGNRLAPSPISLIRIDARARGLSVHTFHSFPDERAIVRTHSLFESRLALPAR